MKKFFALFVALVACSVFAFADGFNAPKSATANFDCKVIAPLTWTNPTTASFLDEVIAGQTRDIANVDYTFTLNGEALEDVTITTHEPIADAGNPSVTVSLDGSWSTPPTALDGTGKATVTYTVDKLVSTNANDHGDYNFTISVDAVYTSL